ncbi:hypothetical protein ABES08_03365 [Peribacillus simplex]
MDIPRQVIGKAEIVYFYNLIMDHDVNMNGQKELIEKGEMSDASNYLGSYQSIEIFDAGRIHIVHQARYFSGFYLSASLFQLN